MKRICACLVTIPFLLSFYVASAQSQGGKPFLSIGPEFSWDTRGSYRIGVGGSLKFGIPISQRSTITLSPGYITFLGEPLENYSGTYSRNLNMTLIPLSAGFRYRFNNGVYLEP